MRNAAKALGIEVYITELGVVKSRIDQNNALRSDYLVSQRAVREMQLRKALNKAMSDLQKAIELAKVTNKTFDFGPFDTEIGVLFTFYRSKLRNRSTRRINNVIKKESAATTAKSVATETLENGLV
jgi:type VI protein secretion system component Hcp